jgi:hypothetical protein
MTLENWKRIKPIQKCFHVFSSALTSGLEVVESPHLANGGLSHGHDVLHVVISGFSNDPLKSPGSFGLLALRPEDGAEVWRQELEAKPYKHDCNLVDLNGDGLRDCVVVGARGLFNAVDPKTGKICTNALRACMSGMIIDF